MPTRMLMTMHAPMSREIANLLFGPTRELMNRFGFPNWVAASGEVPPSLTLMVDCPQVWCDRSATKKELEHFRVLYDAGHIEEARAFAQVGWPEE